MTVTPMSQSITSWLSSVQSPPPARKRRRTHQERSEEDSTPPDQFQGAAQLDDASNVSISPTKQLSAIRLHDDGFRVDRFGAQPLPPQLAALVEDMETYSFKMKVIPEQLRESVTCSGQVDKRLLQSAFSDAPHLVPLDPHTAQDIVDEAILYGLADVEEAAWNGAVHTRLLLAAGRSEKKPRLVNFVSCTTARISPQYQPRNAPSKMVDFCLYINPSADPDIRATRRIEEVRQDRPEISINHTNYNLLLDLPIAVSIETKKNGSHWQEAMLQLGTWQTAQLRTVANSALFLPGFIVTGHYWYFVATVQSPEGGQPKLLENVLVGTTENVIGVYGILAAISRLRLWAETEFWPAFKRDVLGLF